MKRQEFQPIYLALPERDRLNRIGRLEQILRECILCPRECRVDRLAGIAGQCGAAGTVVVSSAQLHFGEESVLVGTGGSGTIFFVYCNMNCVFCQNWPISRGLEQGDYVSIEELSDMMLRLQEWGCHNINLVSPTPYLFQIASAINRAAGQGLKIPIVYNSGGYESEHILKLLEGFVDIYMPDAKYSSDLTGELYSGVKGYYTHLQRALVEMQRQVGNLAVDREGIARRGLLVRHLVMPGDIAGTAALAAFLRDKISPRCAINVMAQYYPARQAGEYPKLGRRITAAEYRRAVNAVRAAGLRLID